MTITVSFSELFKWDTCQRQYYYSYILGLRPLEVSPAMATGTKGHRLLQNFYTYLQEGKTKEEALKLTHDSAKNLLTKGIVDGPLLVSWTLVDNYIRATDFTNVDAVEVETRFLFPASLLDSDPALSNVQIGFTPDVVFRRKGDFYDVEDYKFVGRAWSRSKMNRFQQAKLYQIFLRRMGYNVSRSIVRFFNTTTAKITIQSYTLSSREEQTIIDDFIESIREVVRYKNKPEFVFKNTRRTMNYTACQYCAFEHPCTLEAEGKDATQTLKNMYQKSDYDYNV